MVGVNLRGLGTIQSITGGKHKPKRKRLQGADGFPPNQVRAPSDEQGSSAGKGVGVGGEGGGVGGGGQGAKLVECPVCGCKLPEIEVNTHLDLCLGGAAPKKKVSTPLVQPTLARFLQSPQAPEWSPVREQGHRPTLRSSSGGVEGKGAVGARREWEPGAIAAPPGSVHGEAQSPGGGLSAAEGRLAFTGTGSDGCDPCCQDDRGEQEDDDWFVTYGANGYCEPPSPEVVELQRRVADPGGSAALREGLQACDVGEGKLGGCAEEGAEQPGAAGSPPPTAPRVGGGEQDSDAVVPPQPQLPGSGRTQGANLQHLITTVLDRDGALMSAGEHALLTRVGALTGPALELLSRLLSRKGPWFRLDALRGARGYEDGAAADLAAAGAVDLAAGGQGGERSGGAWGREREEDLKEKLDVLNVLELREVMVRARALPRGEAGKALRPRLLAAPFGRQLGAASLLQRVETEWAAAAGPCVRVAPEYEVLQCRLERLFFLNESQDLKQFLLADIGVHRYPSYATTRSGPVFASRGALLAYEGALEAAGALEEAVESGDMGAGIAAAEPALAAVLAGGGLRGPPPSFSEIPDYTVGAEVGGGGAGLVREAHSSLFLRRYTSEYITCCMATLGVSLLERAREYARAADVLRALLASRYTPGRRGHWWMRLSVNEEHMNHPGAAMEAAEAALEDEWVRGGDRLGIQRRLLRLSKLQRRWKVWPWKEAAMIEPREVQVVARPLNNQAGVKSRFPSPSGSGECGVEEYALHHYAAEANGGWRGSHTEGGVFGTLMGLLLWEALFAAGVPDVFQTPFQTAPLDLSTDAFYPSRRALVESLLARIRGGEGEAMLRASWTAHEGQFCIGVRWDAYPLDELCDIVRCLGGVGLATVMRLLSAEYGGRRGGMPDLLLWHVRREVTRVQAKLVEVKGPRDRLSDQQRVWLREMEGAGLDVEVFKVKEEAAKRGGGGRGR